jgi:hypothetical protein
MGWDRNMHSLEVNMVMDLTPLSRQAGRGPSCTVMTHVRPAESTTQQAAYMLVTEIILVKVSRLCQLLSNSRGFPSALRFLNPLAQTIVFIPAWNLKNKKMDLNWGLKYMYYNVHCTYL